MKILKYMSPSGIQENFFQRKKVKLSYKTRKNFFSLFLDKFKIKNSFSICLRICNFLNLNIRGNCKNKNLVSRFFLLKFRGEFPGFGFFSQKEKTWFRKKKKERIKIVVLNKILLYPVHKISHQKNLQTLAFLILEKKFHFFQRLKKITFSNFSNSKKFFCLGLYPSEKKKKLFFRPNLTNFSIIQKAIIFGKSFLFFNGTKSVVSLSRKLYGIKILISFLSLGFIKIDIFSQTLKKKNFRKKKKSNINKLFSLFNFDPLLQGTIRFDLKKGIFSLKPKPFPFEIFHSKSKIPIKICLHLKKIIYFYKQTIFESNFEGNFLKSNQIPSKIFNLFDLEKNIKSWNSKEKIFGEKFLRNYNFENSITFSFLKKAEDFLNEVFGTIHLSQFDKIFREDQLDLWVNPIQIQSIDYNTGFLEIIPNSISIHDLKKTLRFNKKKTCSNSPKFPKNFVQALVGYSLFCFFLQIKDRHNANILLTPQNRQIHIDFGFIMGSYPGNLKFEANYFKFSSESMSEIGGKRSEFYEKFKELFIRGFFSIRKNFAKILRITRKFLTKMIENNLNKNKLVQFQKRISIFHRDTKLIRVALSLIEESAENWKTHQYDRYQLHASGIN